MNNAAAFQSTDWVNTQPASIDASDDFEAPGQSRYCPASLLATFVELMAARGRATSSEAMLGDRDYAMWPLARAQAMGDREPRPVEGRLCA